MCMEFSIYLCRVSLSVCTDKAYVAQGSHVCMCAMCRSSRGSYLYLIYTSTRTSFSPCEGNMRLQPSCQYASIYLSIPPYGMSGVCSFSADSS